MIEENPVTSSNLGAHGTAGDEVDQAEPDAGITTRVIKIQFACEYGANWKITVNGVRVTGNEEIPPGTQLMIITKVRNPITGHAQQPDVD